MLMMQDTACMVVNLMEAVLLWNLLGGVHVAQEVHVNIWEEGRHLEPGVALIVVLMATGLVIAKPGTGKTSAIAVEKEAI